MPCSGKTTIINTIKNKELSNVFVVDEIILNSDNYNQNFFMKNDIAKINKYKEGTIIIDRGLISTLSYNITLKKISINDEYNNVIKWFNKYGIDFYHRDCVITYYLKNEKFKLRCNNELDPYGSIENQKLLQRITINNIKKYCLNYKIVKYNFENMEEFINEIIN